MKTIIEHFRKAGMWACTVLITIALGMGLFLIPGVSPKGDLAFGAIVSEAVEPGTVIPMQDPSEDAAVSDIAPISIQEENPRVMLSDADQDATSAEKQEDNRREGAPVILDSLDIDAREDETAPGAMPDSSGISDELGLGTRQEGEPSDTADEEALLSDDLGVDGEEAEEGVQEARALDSSAPVMDLTEFRAAVIDPSVTYITLGADITLTARITIPASKTELTIDGQGLFTLEQNAAATALYSTSTVGANYTFKDLKVLGRDFFGLVYCTALTSAPTITVHNIDYSGPQLIYNRYGKAVFTGVNNIVIQANGATSNVAEEVAEVHGVSISGTLKLRTNTTGFSFFWMFGTSGERPYLTIEPGADAVFEAANSSPYGFFFINDQYVDFTVSDGADLHMNLTGFNPLCSGLTHRIQSMTIGRNATAIFDFAGGVALHGSLSIQEGAFVKMNYLNSPATGSSARLFPLFWLTNPTGGATLIDIDRPKAVVFAVQPPNMPIFNRTLASTGILRFTTTDVNYWNAYAAAAANAEPTALWYSDESNAFTGSMALGLGADSLSSIDSNHEGFSAGFKPAQSRVVQWGTDPMPLSAPPIQTHMSRITGNTVPGASVYASYEGVGGQIHRYSGICTAQGNFSIDITENSLVAAEPVFLVSVDSFIAVHTDVPVSEAQSPSAKPVLQVIEKDTPFPIDGLSLLTDIVSGSEGPVEASIVQVPDTSIVGPTSAQVILINSMGMQITVTVPVFVTDEYVVLDDDRMIALRAEDFSFDKNDFPADNVDGFILERSNARAWRLMTGEDITDEVVVASTTLANASGIYDATLAMQGLDRTIRITVSDHNDWVNVRIPTSMLFGTLDLNEDGTIISPRYEIENKSMYDVKVGLGAFGIVQSGGLSLVANGNGTPGNPELNLGLDINGFSAIGTLLPFNDPDNPVPLTTLNAGQTKTITLSGKYFGQFGDTPIRPEYSFVWSFDTYTGEPS